MKRAVICLTSVFLSFIFISSATAVPVTQSIPYHESVDSINERIHTFASSKAFKRLDGLLDRHITDDIRLSLRESIYENFSDVLELSDDVDFDGLVDILIVIAGVLLAIFGHNIIGLSITFFVVAFIALIPSAIVAFGISLSTIPTVFFAVINILANYIEIIYAIGILGFFVFAISLVVLAIIFSALAVPVGTIILTPVILTSIIYDVIDRVY